MFCITLHFYPKYIRYSLLFFYDHTYLINVSIEAIFYCFQAGKKKVLYLKGSLFAFWPWNLKNSFEYHNWQYMKTETGYIVWIWFCGWSEFQLGFPTLYQFSCFTKKLQFQARCRTYCLQPWLKCSNEQKKHEIFTFFVSYFPESRKNIWDTAARIERKVKSTIFFSRD